MSEVELGGPNSLTTTHLIIIIGVFTVVLIVSFFVIPIKYRTRATRINKIPRDIMPFLRPGDLSTKQRKVILNELVREKQIEVKPQIKAEKMSGHFGWGAPGMALFFLSGTEYTKVHFKTSIAKSYIILERAAMHRDRALARPPSMCVRDYMNFLEQNCSELNHNLCRFYVDTYERARFSEDEFTLGEYTSFMAKFLVLIQAFESDVTFRHYETDNNDINNNSKDKEPMPSTSLPFSTISSNMYNNTSSSSSNNNNSNMAGPSSHKQTASNSSNFSRSKSRSRGTVNSPREPSDPSLTINDDLL